MEKILLVFLIIQITSSFNLISSQQIQTPKSDDQYALLALKSHITSDPEKILSNWSPNVTICRWAGVSCTTNKRVMSLNLSSSFLEGTIPPHIGNLTFLNELNFSFNNLNGFIPFELGSLGSLKYVNLAYNNFTGEIPASVGNLVQLQKLFLQNNSISGSIPSSLGSLANLEILNLAYNFLDGELPNEIRNLSNLKILSLGGNEFSGELPNGIFKNMSSLQEIGLAFNGFSGGIPLDMCENMPNLRGIFMAFNQFEGPIAPEIYKCKKLEYLSLGYNKFNSFPKEIGYLSNLKGLIIGGNFFTTGGIPQEIGNLTQLTILVLESSFLTGQIPASIFNISSLTLLDLSNNSLSGSLPTFPRSNLPVLQNLDVSTNALTGHIPSFLFECKSLQVLALKENKFTGEIPTQIGNLTSLRTLLMGDNQLTGQLPSEIANLRNLDKFSFGINSLQGTVPPEIFNMSSLTGIDLMDNNFTGRLPSTMWTTLPNIESIYLSDNGFTGTIPSSINNATKLRLLVILSTSISGTIPHTIGDLQFLQGLYLGENNLTRDPSTQELTFITALTRCRNLQAVELSLNQFNGYLPTSVGNLSSSLRLFNMFNSKLIGRIPLEIGNMSSLESINMDSNEFTGSIPPTIGKLTRLDRLYLEHNRLQGPIVRELCEIPNLGDLYLSDNMLSGPIPDCLGEIKSLRRVYLQSNNLSSTIPASIWNLHYLLELNLSFNSFTGHLPLEIQNLKVITVLDLSWNLLSGELPSTLGSSQSLDRLSLAHNQFSGSIPQSFGNVLSLETLDLSDNRFSGTIPKSLENLRYLKDFNVSFNQLEGQIPTGGSFVNFTSRSFLDNYALCGSERMNFPPCHSNKHGGSGVQVLKYVLPAVAAAIVIAAAIACVCMRTKRKQDRKAQPETSFPSNFMSISYYELLRATDSFGESCLLGTGSFGSVYRGTLADGSVVAVKVFHMQSDASEKSFTAESEVMGSIRHRNLVKVLGCCCNLDFKALILDYMPNGNLDMWLYSYKNLNLMERLNVAIDVAAALEYLHHDHAPAVVHCDLKPSNILLDEDKVAHLCDFGIAKLFEEGESMVQTKTLATIGYMAPEYGAKGIVSTCGDVYSYGVILLEMLTSKRPTDDVFVEGLNLKRWVAKAIQGNSIIDLIDPRLISKEDHVHFSAKEACIVSLLQLAMECLPELPQQRINMRDIVARLQKIKTTLLSNGDKPL